METPKSILVIDDEPAVVKLLKITLENEGFDVLTAANGQEGLACLKQHTPNLIVLDLNMPVMNGFEFFTAICTPHGRSKYPTLILTEKTQMKAVFDTVEGDGFIAKPFELEDFLAAVKQIFDREGYAGTVIIVDPGMMESDGSLKKVLETERYRVSIAHDYTEFEAASKTSFPDFVALEYAQEKMHGDEFILKAKAYLSQIRSDLPLKGTTKFIVYTHSGMDYRQKAMQAGADLYLRELKNDDDMVTSIRTLEMEKPGS